MFPYSYLSHPYIREREESIHTAERFLLSKSCSREVLSSSLSTRKSNGVGLSETSQMYSELNTQFKISKTPYNPNLGI